ncbi:MAG: hypothetical protein V4495_11300 [Pseudomonadota bacterium]
MNTAFLQVIKDAELARDLSRIADDFDILGFFHHFGSSCFAMSALLAQILTAKGYKARVQGCYAEIRQGNGVFYIGYQGFAHQGQKEGHVVCLVEDKYLVDFGLGTLKKHYAADFKPALACSLASNADGAGVIAHLPLNDGIDMVWRNDWISPMVEAELRIQAPTVQRISAVFEDFQKNRVAHLVKKLFTEKYPPATGAALLVLRQPQTDPNETPPVQHRLA